MRNRIWSATKVIMLLVLAAVFVYVTKFAPTHVTKLPVQHSEITSEVMGTGTLEARVATSISPKISGRIVEVFVDQGQRVKAGDLLLRLDDDEHKQQIEIARANLSAKEAAIERLKSDKLRTAAVHSQAKNDFDRLSKLTSAQAASVSALDKAREALAIAQAGLTHSEAAMAEAQEELVAAEKTLEYQRTLLANTKVMAPFEGLIVSRDREPGDVVVPGSSILRLISTDELWINAWVDETEMSKLSEEQTAKVIFRSESSRSYLGKVARLGKQADRETREFVVDVSVLELPKNWAVGQRADVFIEVAKVNSTIVVPTRAIVLQQNSEDITRRPGVFLLADGAARWQDVELGIRGSENVEVLRGLSTKDVVIVPVDQEKALKDGTRVLTK